MNYLKSETFPGFGRLRSKGERDIIHMLIESLKPINQGPDPWASFKDKICYTIPPKCRSQKQKLEEAWDLWRRLMEALAPLTKEYKGGN
jgi:hypothetical protein